MISDGIFLDCETTGLQPCYGARITCICAKTSAGEWFKEAREDEEQLLKNFFAWLKGKEKFTLITANGKDFDVPFIVIRASILGMAKDSYAPMLSMAHFDMQTVTYRKISLSDMGELLLGDGKRTDGKTAILFFAERRFDKLIEYCTNDVELTERVYLAYMRNKEKVAA